MGRCLGPMCGRSNGPMSRADVRQDAAATRLSRLLEYTAAKSCYNTFFYNRACYNRACYNRACYSTFFLQQGLLQQGLLQQGLLQQGLLQQGLLQQGLLPCYNRACYNRACYNRACYNRARIVIGRWATASNGRQFAATASLILRRGRD